MDAALATTAWNRLLLGLVPSRGPSTSARLSLVLSGLTGRAAGPAEGQLPDQWGRAGRRGAGTANGVGVGVAGARVLAAGDQELPLLLGPSHSLGWPGGQSRSGSGLPAEALTSSWSPWSICHDRISGEEGRSPGDQADSSPLPRGPPGTVAPSPDYSGPLALTRGEDAHLPPLQRPMSITDRFGKAFPVGRG